MPKDWLKVAMDCSVYKSYSEGKGIHTQPHTCCLREEDYSSVVWTCWKLNPQCNRADRPGPWELITLWGRGVRENQCCYHRRVLVAECGGGGPWEGWIRVFSSPSLALHPPLSSFFFFFLPGGYEVARRPSTDTAFQSWISKPPESEANCNLFIINYDSVVFYYRSIRWHIFTAFKVCLLFFR